MPLRLDIKKKLSARSDRVKCVDFHPTEPWALSALYSGNIFIWDYNTQTLVKQLEVCNLPVRCGKFVTRKQWIITASDDMHLRAFNYNTLEKVHEFEAHSDYIRYVAVHPSMPYVLSSSDDMTIKLWDWDKNWNCNAVFEGHAHYVMMCQWNPKDNTIFASCSLDRSIKVWGTTGNNTTAHFTLSGHKKGVNCVEYAPTGEKPYLITGADDRTVCVWDYQTKQCIQTLSSHTNNVSAALFHPTLPIILTGSEDGTVRIWHAATYRLEATLNYLLERVWSIAVLKGSNSAAIGYDEGTVVIKLGSEEPIASMHGGKIIWAKGNEIQTANLKRLDEGTAAADGERVPVPVQDMGAAEIFPQYIAHHPNGRLFAVCGDGEYVVYTAQALRNKSFGSALEFVWGHSGAYATRDSAGKITVFQDFKENFSFKPPFAVDAIFGGRLIAVVGNDFVCFYEWTEYRLVRRIDVVPKEIVWSDDGTNVVLGCGDNFYILKHDKDAMQAAFTSGEPIDEDGIEAAFELISEVSEKVLSGLWVSDCFVYVNASQRLLCLVAGSTETIAHLDHTMYLLGYLPDVSKLFLVDKELNVVPYTLHLALVEYQSAIMKKDFDAASKFFEQLPESLHNRVARFLENQGYPSEALQISKDDDHCFELATQLGKLEQAADFIRKIAATNPAMPPRGKWKTLGDVAMEQGNFDLARNCFKEAKDLGALFLMHTACGDADELRKTAVQAKEGGIANIAVICFLLLGDLENALQVLVAANRLPEAAFFARCYCPSQLSEVVKLWKTDLALVNQAVADSLADPASYPDLFPSFSLTVAAENVFKQKRQTAPAKALQYAEVKAFHDELNVMEKIAELQPAGFAQLIMKGSGAAAAPAVAPAPVRQEAPAPVEPAPAPVVQTPAAPPPEMVTPAEMEPERVEAAPEAAAPEAETVDLLGGFTPTAAAAPEAAAADVDLLGEF
jgi:coatomer subunit beta'